MITSHTNTAPIVSLRGLMMALVLTLPLGCSGSKPEEAPKAEVADTGDGTDGASAVDPGSMDDVDRAVAIAKEIMRAPENADTILARYDLDRVGLDELVYKISADPALRRRYSEQLTKRN